MIVDEAGLQMAFGYSVIRALYLLIFNDGGYGGGA